MANANNTKGTGRITRIRATDDSRTPKKSPTAKNKPAVSGERKQTSQSNSTDENRQGKNPLAAVVRYVKGAWYELRQVRWPDRRSTWSMTGALIAFTLFFVVIILLLDAGFQQLFKLMIGK